MKILFITDLYPIKEEEKTTPKALHNFVKQWIEQGHIVDVIKPNFLVNNFFRKKNYYPGGWYKYDDVNILNINYHTPFLFDFTKKIVGINYSDYDVVIAHMPVGIIFANKLVNIIKKPLICGVHQSDIEVLKKPIYSIYFKNQIKKAYRNAKKIACRSLVLQKKLAELLPEFSDKTSVAPSGINSNKLNIDAPEKEINENNLKVLTCANFIKRKNIDKLIHSIKDIEGFELTVIGDGKEKNKLKKIKAKNVKFIGWLKNDDVLEKMKESDIFILPSVNETFGLVYLEAMASGCITVCSKNDGIDGIIKDEENGFLCEPTTTEIKNVLLKIKNYPHKKTIIENAVKTAQEYSSKNCARNYLENI